MSNKPYALISICEGSVSDFYSFDTKEEREAFAHGFSAGAGNYGAGSATCVPIPEFAIDREAFLQEYFWIDPGDEATEEAISLFQDVVRLAKGKGYRE